MHRKRIVLKRRNIVLSIIIMIIITIILLFNFINKRVTPLFLDLASSETEKLATLIINDAVGKQVSDGLDSNLLYNLTSSLVKDFLF